MLIEARYRDRYMAESGFGTALGVGQGIGLGGAEILGHIHCAEMGGSILSTFIIVISPHAPIL